MIAELQTEQAIVIERLRHEATQRQEELERQAQETIARAHEATAAAELQARQAETRAHNAETEARIQQALLSAWYVRLKQPSNANEAK